MAHGEVEKTLSVGKEKLWATILKYEDYPEFVDGVTGIQVDRQKEGEPKVTYSLNLFKEFSYVLQMKENPEGGSLSWELLESDVFKVNRGSWKIEENGPDSCNVRYELDVEFKIPVPGFILKKLVKGNLPAMVQKFEQRAMSS